MNDDRPRWRQYRVARRVPESAAVISLELVAADGKPLQPFRPGQFLTFRLTGAAGRPVPKNYSISSDPADTSHFRISVRRQVPAGVGSCFMHDEALDGVVLEGSDPKGQFVLDEASHRPVLLLAGGIGITPLLAMAHALAKGRRDTVLIHACESAAAQPFRGEVRALCDKASNLRAYGCFQGSDTADHVHEATDFTGLVTADTLRKVLPIGDYDVYLCGPPAFMQAMFVILLSLGVRESQIRYEFFGPATVLGRAAVKQAGQAEQAGQVEQAGPVPAPAALDGATDVAAGASASVQIMVTFAASGLNVVWDHSSRSLLDFAEAQGLSPAFSCRNGICNTCLCALTGDIRYVDEPLEDPASGTALICCSVPTSPVTLDL